MKDDTWLSAQFPIPLVRTNMEGVYTTPAPPDHLNFETASSAAVAQYGLLLHRPKPGDSAAVISAWKRITEKGLRILAPILEPLPEPVRRPRGSPGRWPNGPQALSTNWCGCVLEGAGNWSSVVGTFRLPYLNAPYGVQASECAGLSAWVGLDGWKAAPLELLQTIMNFNLDASTNPPSAFFNYPTWQWWIPDPNDPNASSYFGGGTVMNAPAMKSGDLVQLSCAYATGLDGSPWGHVSFLFYNDQSNGSPVLMNFMFPGPPTVAGQGGSIEWIMENEAATNNQSDTIVPVFSATPNSITPITFTQAAGSSQSGSVIGNPLDGFTVLWEDSPGQASNVAAVSIAPQEVSILYKGEIPPPVDCAELVQSIQVVLTTSLRLTGAQWAQAKQQLLNCRSEGRITEAQYQTLMGEIARYSTSGSNESLPEP